jgi:hypothetical protein
LKQSLLERFQHERILELNETKYQKFLELSEKIKDTKEKKALYSLNAELKALNYVPLEPSDMVCLETIQTRVQRIHQHLVTQERQLMDDGEFGASMLCEVERLNLLNLMKVFEIPVAFEDVGLGQQTNDERELSALREQTSLLEEQLFAKVYTPLLPEIDTHKK